jgi:pimeloyl-ACP methyl ester carboxylesterase
MLLPLLLLLVWSSCASEVLPLVLLHGMLATNNSMAPAESWARATFPGIYVLNLQTGNSLDAVLNNLNTMCTQVAELLKADPKLQNGFNAIGHSQGGLLLRSVVVRHRCSPSNVCVEPVFMISVLIILRFVPQLLCIVYRVSVVRVFVFGLLS